MSYVVEVELIGSDEAPRQVYGSFRTEETARRFADRILAALPGTSETGEFVAAHVLWVHPARLSDVREDGWMDY